MRRGADKAARFVKSRLAQRKPISLFRPPGCEQGRWVYVFMGEAISDTSLTIVNYRRLARRHRRLALPSRRFANQVGLIALTPATLSNFNHYL